MKKKNKYILFNTNPCHWYAHFAFTILAKSIWLCFFFFGIYVVIKLQNRNDECLLVAGYVVGRNFVANDGRQYYL
jgi:hypothetical protein